MLVLRFASAWFPTWPPLPTQSLGLCPHGGSPTPGGWVTFRGTQGPGECGAGHSSQAGLARMWSEGQSIAWWSPRQAPYTKPASTHQEKSSWI